MKLDKQEDIDTQIQVLSDRLKRLSATDYPDQHATSQYNLGTLYISKYKISNEKSDLINADNAFKEALKVKTLESNQILAISEKLNFVRNIKNNHSNH